MFWQFAVESCTYIRAFTQTDRQTGTETEPETETEGLCWQVLVRTFIAANPVEACDVRMRGTVALEDAAPEAPRRHSSTAGDVETPFLSQQILEEPQVHVVWLEMDPAVTTPRNRRGADHNLLEFRQSAWAEPRDDPCTQSEAREACGSDTELSSCATSKSHASIGSSGGQIAQQKMEEARKEVAAADLAVSEARQTGVLDTSLFAYAEVLVEASRSRHSRTWSTAERETH